MRFVVFGLLVSAACGAAPAVPAPAGRPTAVAPEPKADRPSYLMLDDVGMYMGEIRRWQEASFRDVCETADRICEDATDVCRIARELEHGWAEDKCRDARDACRAAEWRCGRHIGWPTERTWLWCDSWRGY